MIKDASVLNLGFVQTTDGTSVDIRIPIPNYAVCAGSEAADAKVRGTL